MLGTYNSPLNPAEAAPLATGAANLQGNVIAHQGNVILNVRIAPDLGQRRRAILANHLDHLRSTGRVFNEPRGQLLRATGKKVIRGSDGPGVYDVSKFEWAFARGEVLKTPSPYPQFAMLQVETSLNNAVIDEDCAVVGLIDTMRGAEMAKGRGLVKVMEAMAIQGTRRCTNNGKSEFRPFDRAMVCLAEPAGSMGTDGIYNPLFRKGINGGPPAKLLPTLKPVRFETNGSASVFGDFMRALEDHRTRGGNNIDNDMQGFEVHLLRKHLAVIDAMCNPDATWETVIAAMRTVSNDQQLANHQQFLPAKMTELCSRRVPGWPANADVINDNSRTFMSWFLHFVHDIASKYARIHQRVVGTALNHAKPGQDLDVFVNTVH